MSKWESLSGSPISVPGIGAAIGKFQTANEAIIAALRVIRGALQAVAAIEVSRINATQALIRSIVSEIESIIESLLNDTTVYVLPVPARKKIAVAPSLQAAAMRMGVPVPSRPPAKMFDLQAEILQWDEPVREALQHALRGEGGNAGFVRTVVESLYDPDDTNRPQLDASMWVGGYNLVVGGPDYLSVLSYLSALFSLTLPSFEESAGLPVPQNLRVKPVVSGRGGSKAAALLKWDFQQPVQVQNVWGIQYRVTQVCVIRSTSPSLFGVRNVQEVFGLEPLRKGLRSGDVEVVDVYDYSYTDIKSTYLDEGLEKQPYYYAVGFRYEADGEEPPFRLLSGVTKVNCGDAPPTYGSGAPPDWTRLPALIDLFPDFAYLARWAAAQVNQLGDMTSGYGEVLKALILHIEKVIVRYTESTEEAARLLAKILSLVRSFNDDVGSYGRQFRGIGGNSFLMQDLSSSLSPNNPDPHRPPYDRGDEIVAGMVVLVAAPTAAALTPVLTLLDLIFGGRGSGTVIEQAVAQLGDVFDDLEEAFAGPEDVVSVADAIPGCAPKDERTFEFLDDFTTEI